MERSEEAASPMGLRLKDLVFVRLSDCSTFASRNDRKTKGSNDYTQSVSARNAISRSRVFALHDSRAAQFRTDLIGFNLLWSFLQSDSRLWAVALTVRDSAEINDWPALLALRFCIVPGQCLAPGISKHQTMAIGRSHGCHSHNGPWTSRPHEVGLDSTGEAVLELAGDKLDSRAASTALASSTIA
jgi:hypothetical protein